MASLIDWLEDQVALEVALMPWHYVPEDGGAVEDTAGPVCEMADVVDVSEDETEERGEFIVAAVNTLPDLLKVARAARELLRDLKREYDWDDGTPIECALEPLFGKEVRS